MRPRSIAEQIIDPLLRGADPYKTRKDETSERRCERGVEPKSSQRGNKEVRTETGEDMLQVLFRNDAVGVVVDQ